MQPRNKMKSVLAAVLMGLGLAAISAAGAAAMDTSVTKQFTDHTPGAQASVDHAPWQAFLDAYAVEGADGITRVNYVGVSPADRQALDAYLVSLSKTEPASLDRGEQFAYWVNLYNALTVRIVLDHYPVPSIRKIKLGRVLTFGPWGQDIFMVDGAALSLDNIEHDILRAIWRDPRIHYAVNCASLGCPNLSRTAFTADNADSLLEAGARAYVNHPRGVNVEDGGLKVSSLYKWYKNDFGGSDEALLAHLRQYALPDLQGALDGHLPIKEYDYDWSLNEVPPDGDKN